MMCAGRLLGSVNSDRASSSLMTLEREIAELHDESVIISEGISLPEYVLTCISTLFGTPPSHLHY